MTEYKIVSSLDGIIVPYIPMYRKKMVGWKIIFQPLFRWKYFPKLCLDNNIRYPLRFGSSQEAHNFLVKISSPYSYITNLNKIRDDNWAKEVTRT